MMDREEDYLSNFFTQVSQLSFDKAKELVEREKEVSNLQSTPWNMLIGALAQFAGAERSYVELGFFANRQKSFLRKDNSLRSCYEQLRSDMHRIEDMSKHNRTVLTVAYQLGHFMTARVELIEFYEKIQACAATKPIKFSELLGSLEDLVDRHSLSCPHLALTCLKASLNLECEILVHLVKAGSELADWRYLPSLMLLHGAHTRLQAWETSLTPGSRESWRLGSFLAAPRLPPLYQWLVRLKGVLCAKFALLFHDTLIEQSSASEMKVLCAKLNPAVDYHHKLHSFQHKSGSVGLLIVFDTFGLPDHEGPGYKLLMSTPSRLSPGQTSPTGAESPSTVDPRYVQVLCLPQAATRYLADITKLVLEKTADLCGLDKVTFHYNVRDQQSIFMIGIDPRLTIVTLFSGKRTEKDTMTITFLMDMASQLRGNRILASLKPGSK